MAEGLQFMIDLVDQLSGPAKQMSFALDQLDSHLKKVQGDAGKLSDTMKHVGGQTGGTGSLFGRGFSAMAFGANQAIEMFGHLKHAVEIPLHLAEKGAEMVLDAMAFRGHMMRGLEAALGTQEAAKRVYEESAGIARLTATDAGAVGDQRMRLILGGFSEGASRVIQAAALDVGKALGEDKGDMFTQAITRIHSQGKLSPRSLEALSQMGVRRDLILDELAKQAGIHARTPAELQKRVAAAVESGLISSDQAINAALNTVEKTLSHGKVGSFALKAGQGITGMIFNIKHSFEELLRSMDFDKIPGIAIFKDAVKNLQDALDPTTDAGARLRRQIEQVVDQFGRMFEVFSGPQGAERIMRDLEGVLSLIEKIEKGIKGINEFYHFGSESPVSHTLFPTSEEINKDPWADINKYINQMGLGTTRDLTGIQLAPYASSAALPAIAAPPPTVNAAGYGRTVNNQNTVNITVNAGGATAADANHIANRVREAMPSANQSAFEGMAAESGAQ